MLLLKTVSRISNDLFTHHEKCKKHLKLHVHRKNQAITFHVKMLRLNHVSKKNTNTIHVSQNIQIRSLQKCI